MQFKYRAFRVVFSLFTALCFTYLFTTPEPDLPDNTGIAVTVIFFTVVLLGMLRFTYSFYKKGWWD